MAAAAKAARHQLVEAQRLPQQLQLSEKGDVGFVLVFRQAAYFLVGRALLKLLVGRLVRQGPLLAGLRDPEPWARPPELRQPLGVEVRCALNEQVAVEGVEGGAWHHPGSFAIVGLRHDI